VVKVKRALVIDDDASIRILITRILARYEFSVDAAADGGEGIELMRDNDYDVIVLDLMMPRIDGFGVLKFLSEHDPDKLQRVIVMTAC
jgi:DNA-binding response OmpR family regulator